MPSRGRRAGCGALPDRGRDRSRFAGRRTRVGMGHSAANTLLDLARLARDAPGTEVVWAIRRADVQRIYGGERADQLPARGRLGSDLQRGVDSGRSSTAPASRSPASRRAATAATVTVVGATASDSGERAHRRCPPGRGRDRLPSRSRDAGRAAPRPGPGPGVAAAPGAADRPGLPLLRDRAAARPPRAGPPAGARFLDGRHEVLRPGAHLPGHHRQRAGALDRRASRGRHGAAPTRCGWCCRRPASATMPARAEDWELDDPKGQDEATVRRIVADIDQRVAAAW